MEAMTARPNWSDDRIDGLERKVDEGFRHVDQRFEQVDKRFEQVDKRFEQMDKRFEKVEGELQGLRTDLKSGFDLIHDRLHSFQRTLILFCGGLITGLLGILATQL
jgi:tetrahydromethanopterin S-methyltransferase subunit G